MTGCGERCGTAGHGLRTMTHRVCTDSVLSIQASKRGDLSEQESTCTPIFQ